MNRKKVILILLCFNFMLFNQVVYAEIRPPKPEYGNQPSPVGLPIDGGLSLLLASGVAYGIYSIKRKK